MHEFLLEFGISLPKGLAIMKRLSTVLAEHDLPARLTALLQRLHEHFCYLDEQIKALDKELAGQLTDDDLGRRLLSIPCVEPITASLLAIEMGDGKQYGCSRDFAASVSLVPRQYSTGGKTNLLEISKRGKKTSDGYWFNAPVSICRGWSISTVHWPSGCAHYSVDGTQP